MATDAHSGRLPAPTVAHYVALVASFALLLWIGRDQWFFGDDWAILAPSNDGDVLLPHVGHWNLVPATVFPLLRNWLGLGSYLPYLALAVLAHLAVVHVLWRILGRIGTAPWVATGLSVLVMVLGAGAENLLWAFQFGFLGAIALGLAVVLLLDSPELHWRRVLAIVVCSVLAPMFSGTAIPVLAAAAIVGWIRHGFGRTFALLAPTAAIYLLWYFLIARQYPTPHAGIESLGDAGMVVVFAAAMFGAGLGRAFVLLWIGVIPAAVAGVWFIATVRRGIRTVTAPAYALIIGSVVFAALTAYSRASFGLSASSAQRYAYLTIVLLLPAFSLMLSWLVLRGRVYRALVAVFLVAMIGLNGAALVVAAGVQSARELGSQERVDASLVAIIQNPTDPALLTSVADPRWAPDLYGSDLLWLYEAGQLEPSSR
jgi:hypothetical protein